MSVAVVKKNVGGYRVVYSGIESNVKLVSKKFGLSHNYLPAIEKTPLPIYYGIIDNPDISQVKVLEEKRSIEEQAKTINVKGKRLWLMFMDKFEGSRFKIIGVSTEGEELTKIDDDIAPYYADQAPFKSPYE